MAKDYKTYNWTYLVAIVAIVAIVGMIVLFNGNKTAPVSEENMGGMAVSRGVKLSISVDPQVQGVNDCPSGSVWGCSPPGSNNCRCYTKEELKDDWVLIE